MSATNDMLTGLTQATAALGMTRAWRMPSGQGFDLAAALFGAPDAAFDRLPSQAQALLLQGLILDFTARALPGPGAGLRAMDMRRACHPSCRGTVRSPGQSSRARTRDCGDRHRGGRPARAGWPKPRQPSACRPPR